jgi:hypothetical protein
MTCPVCDGSGLSPGVLERFGECRPCGGCNGTGLRSVWRDEPEPVPGGTGALEHAIAFQRLYENVFGTPQPVHEREDYSRLSGVQLDLAALKIERRYTAEVPNLIAGRTTAATAANLEAIAADYRRLAREADRGLLFDQTKLERKAADTVEALARARQNLGELAAAERSYREAQALYAAFGDDAKAANCAASLATLKLRADRDVDSALADLHARLEAATDPVDVAEIDLDIADLHFTRNDDFGAEEYLSDAKRLLEPHAHRASGAATADAIASVISGGSEAVGGAAETLRIRALLSRLYSGLARARPEEAADYQACLLQLEGSIDQGSRDNAEFSRRMLELMNDLFDEPQ